MTSLTLVRRIAARPSIVFDALTTPEGIAHWWGPDAGPVLFAEADVRIGGRFKVRFRMLDGTEHESSGEYLEVNPPVRLAMTWRWLGREDDDGESRVEIDLRPVDGGTELVFTHAMLSSEESRKGHTEGWNGALDKIGKIFSLTGQTQCMTIPNPTARFNIFNFPARTPLIAPRVTPCSTKR